MQMNKKLIGLITLLQQILYTIFPIFLRLALTLLSFFHDCEAFKPLALRFNINVVLQFVS